MKVSIIGMGAFGIALTKILNKDVKVSMWTNFEDELKSVELKRENSVVLPGIIIDNKVELTTDMQKCIKNSEVIFLAVPAAAIREVTNLLSNYIDENQVICILTKGIEKDTNMFMLDVVNESIDNDVCIFAGPSFAIEVANNGNIGMVIASDKEETRKKVKDLINCDNVCISQTSDVIGVEISSAVKNVFAIICGMIEGMNETDSTRAAILTNLINDFRLIMGILGGKESTIYSYAGIGDFLLTCMSPKSRNYTFGKLLGQTMNAKKALENMPVKTIEGLYTLDAIYSILKQKQVSVNSINLLYDVIYNEKKINNLLKEISN